MLDTLGRCENCGHYVPESTLVSVDLDGEEQVWCQDCILDDEEGSALVLAEQ